MGKSRRKQQRLLTKRGKEAPVGASVKKAKRNKKSPQEVDGKSKPRSPERVPDVADAPKVKKSKPTEPVQEVDGKSKSKSVRRAPEVADAPLNRVKKKTKTTSSEGPSTLHTDIEKFVAQLETQGLSQPETAKKSVKRKKAAVDTGADSSSTKKPAKHNAGEDEEPDKTKAMEEADEAEERAAHARRCAAALEEAEIIGTFSGDESSVSSDSDDENAPPLSKSAKAKLSLEKAKALAEAEKAARQAKNAEKEARMKRQFADGEDPETNEVSAEEKKTEKKTKKEKQEPRPVTKATVAGKKDGQVWIGDIPWGITKDVFREDFSKFGEIIGLSFPLDQKGRTLGTATIRYKDVESAQKVLTLTGIDYKGRTIKVLTRPPRQRAGVRYRASKVGKRKH